MMTESTQTPPVISSVKQNILWLASGLFSVLILSLTASLAPVVFKRLILFHAIFGAAAGMVLLWLATEIRPSWRKSLPAWGAGLCLLGAINMGWLSYRQFQKARADFAAANPRDAALQSMLEKLSVNDPEFKARYEEEERRVHPRFQDFLAHRISSLGDWKTPWPEVFWSVEIFLSGFCCAGTIWLKRVQTFKPEAAVPVH